MNALQFIKILLINKFNIKIIINKIENDKKNKKTQFKFKF